MKSNKNKDTALDRDGNLIRVGDYVRDAKGDLYRVRNVLDIYDIPNPSPHAMFLSLENWTEDYRVYPYPKASECVKIFDTPKGRIVMIGEPIEKRRDLEDVVKCSGQRYRDDLGILQPWLSPITYDIYLQALQPNGELWLRAKIKFIYDVYKADGELDWNFLIFGDVPLPWEEGEDKRRVLIGAPAVKGFFRVKFYGDRLEDLILDLKAI